MKTTIQDIEALMFDIELDFLMATTSHIALEYGIKTF